MSGSAEPPEREQSGSRRASARIRAAAAQVLLDVEHGRSLDDALARQRQLPAAGRPRLMALGYGACRFRPRLGLLVDALLERPIRQRDAVINSLLCVALYEIEAGETPGYAVVDASVEAVRLLGRPRASGLVNALLRRFLRERADLEASVGQQPVARYAHPDWLIETIREDWRDVWQQILDANNAHPPMWLRINRRRTQIADYRDRLAAEGIGATPLALAPQALKLAKPVDVHALPGFADGLVSVQDAAAQLAAPLLAPRSGQRILDACAAPGGKTAHLLELCDGLELLALDIDGDRLARLRSNLDRLGLAATCRTGDAARPGDWWDGRAFDRILLDAPCSASGVIRRHPDIKLLRRPDDIAGLAARQAEMLESLWPLLGPGGMLVYASCSIFERENGQQVQEFLNRHPEASVLGKSANLDRREWRLPGRPGLQILPGDLDMDGFYYACLGKRA